MSVPGLSPQTATKLVDRYRGMLGASAQRLVKFAVVGLFGIGVNSALLALLVEKGHLPPIVAGALATEGAILSNFTLHDHWTFRGVVTQNNWPSRVLRYNLAALGGLGITVTLLAVLTGPLHVYYLVANFFAVGASVAWNYTLSSRVAWAPPQVDYSPDVAQSQPASWAPTIDRTDAAVAVSRR